VPLVREHVFTSSLGYVSIEASVRSQPLADVPVYIRAAFDAGNPIVDATYTQTDEIVSPDGVLFPDGTIRRTTGSGEFPGLGTAIGVTGGLGASLMLSQTLEVSPEVFYRLGIGSITSSARWEQSYIGGGLALRIHPLPSKPPQPEPVAPVEPPIVEAPPQPAPVERPPAVIAAVRSAPLEIRETVVTQTFPLLPYVFFDSASADLRVAYRAAPPVAGFRELDLPKQTLPIYYNVLDILGSRMKARPDATLTVTGTTDGFEASTGAQKLAEQRATSVVAYIRQRWGIAADRFRVKTTEVPSLVSNPAYAEGIEENRRVELSTATAGLLDPVVHTRFNEHVPVQPRHDVTIDVVYPDRAVDWELRVRHRDRKVGSRGGNGAPPAAITFDLTQEMTNDLGPVVGRIDSLDVELVISQREGAPIVATTRFPLIKTVANFEVSRLSLIVFDYNRSDISEQNKDMMRRVVSASAGQGSTATIIGSTDRLGEVGYNLELSSARARSVQAYVRSIAPTLDITQVKGVGASSLPYSNEVPEGRFYCRTVSLTITTPLRGR
jgi:outer membrane protein OmpA-like peptidoglycan-associated protein